MNTQKLRLAGVVKQSIVDGPGLRLTVFTQGCPHKCPGCHNPETHDFAGGYDGDPATILAELDKNPLLAGVTLTGGEPVCQAEALLPLANGVRERGKNLMMYTGYTLEQLLEMMAKDPALAELLSLIDILVDGPFVLAERDLTLLFRGSRNQRLLDLPSSLAKGEPVLWQG